MTENKCECYFSTYKNAVPFCLYYNIPAKSLCAECQLFISKQDVPYYYDINALITLLRTFDENYPKLRDLEILKRKIQADSFKNIPITAGALFDEVKL